MVASLLLEISKTFIAIATATVSFAAPKTETVKIIVLDAPRVNSHSRRVIEIIKSTCSKCEIQHETMYNKKLELDLELMLKKLKSVQRPTRILNLSWNLEYEPSLEPILAELNRITNDGIILVGASGQPEHQSLQSNPLVEDTVLGKVRNIILVAELDAKNKIPLGSYSGSKILFALRNSKSDKGSSFSTAKVSGEIGRMLAEGRFPVLNEMNVEKLVENLFSKKKMAQESWPKVEQLF